MTAGQVRVATETPIQLGPSAARARPGRIALVGWLVGPGERVKKHARLVELRVDDAVIVLTAPVRGTLREVRVQPGQAVQADTVLAVLDSVESASDDPKDVLDRIDAAADPSLALISALLDVIAVKDPSLAETARACAIPRRFDQQVLALLSGADDAEANRLFTDLGTFQFVRTRADGQCSYDESTRQALLREWREPDRHDLFVELNRRMLTFHEAEHDRFRQLDSDLRRIAHVLRRVNNSRYIDLATRVDGLVRATLLELLYHASLISGDELYNMFERLAVEYEARGRLPLCVSLLHSTQSYAQEVALDSERVDWLLYWEGRLLRQLRVDDEADRILGDLIHRLPDGGRLTEWALADLAYLRLSQNRLTEGRELLLRRLEMARGGGGGDPLNLSDAHFSVATASWWVGDLAAAIEHCQRALECSGALLFPNLFSDVAAWTLLSTALRELGRLREAREAALAALDLARGEAELRSQTQLQANALLQLIASIIGADVRLSATLHTEAENLVVQGGDAPDAAPYPVQYADILLKYGRLTAGSALVDALRDGGADQRDASGMLTLLEARAAESQGRFQTGVERLTEFLNRDGQLPDWQRFNALSARGSCNMGWGRWQDAEADLTATLEGWHRIGNTYGAADTYVYIADLRYKTGDLSAAEAALASASAIVGSQRSMLGASIHSIRAKVRHAQGRVNEAAADAREALQIFRDLERPVDALRAAFHIADLAASHGAWSEATEAAANAAWGGRALEKLDGWSPSGRQKSADRANSDGVRALTDESAHPRAGALRARDHFSDAARRGLPGNPWYYLNLSYAHAQLDAWEQAAAAIMRAARFKSSLPKTFLRHRLIEYRLRVAESQADTDVKRATAALAQAVADIDETTPGELRIQAAMMQGDLALRSSAPDLKAVAKAYRRGLEEAERHGRRPYQVALHARLAVAAAQQDDVIEASSRISAAIEVAKTMPEASPADQLTASCVAVLTTRAQFAVFAQMLALVEEGAREGSLQQGLLTDVRLGIARTWYLPSIPAGAGTPESTPPLLQIDADEILFSEGEQTRGLIRMWRDHIPAVVRRVQRDTGVALPVPVIAAQSGYPPGAYVISVNQIPRAFGEVVPDGLFCDAEAARSAGLDGLPYQDPVTGTEGLWLVDDARAAAEEIALPATDAYEFLVRHLEAVARAELASLVGVQDVRRLVEALPATGRLSEWERLTESGRTDRVRVLVSVVHALLSEGVPIRNLAAIVSVVAGAAPEIGISQVLQEARAALRHELPGRNGPGGLLRLRDDLATALEEGLSEGNAEPLAISSDLADLLRQVVRSDRASTQPIRALLVRDQVIRPFVVNLLARDLAGLPVLSESEAFARGTTQDARVGVGSAGS